MKKTTRPVHVLVTVKLMLVAVLLAAVQAGVGIVPKASAQTCNTAPAATFGQVTQSVSVTTAGTYRVWSRIKAPSTTNNSYYFQVDGGCAINVGDATSIAANTWTWVNYKDGNTASFIDINLTAGSHTLKYTGKEADVQLDRVLLLSDTACVPTGLGDNCATADTVAPTASITAPATGTSVTAGSTVTINAGASDNVGVAKVEFYVDGALKSTDTTSPYSYAWNTTGVAAGSHSLTVRAYDAANNSTTSSAVSVTVGAATATGVDLVVTDITWSPAAPAAGSNTTFSIVIKNQGTAATPSGVGIGMRVRVNGGTVSWATHPGSLAAGASATITSTGGPNNVAYWTAIAGSHTVSAEVDDVSTIAESNETNNTLSESLAVGTTAVGAIDQTNNLASGKIFTSSVGVLNNSQVAYVNDKNESTRWISTATDNVTLGTDLGATYNLNKVAIKWAGDTTKNYDIQVSADNTSWTTVATGLTNNTTPQLIEHTLSPSVSARYFRVLAKDRWNATFGNSIWELGIYGTQGPVSGNGDTNNDGRVNALDLSVLISKDGQSFAAADFNGDGTVGAADMAILLSKWTW